MLHKIMNDNSNSRRNFAKKLSAFLAGTVMFSGFRKVFGKTIIDKESVDSVLDTSPYIGEIALYPYNFTPSGWFPCDGRLLPISDYTELFNLIGTTYGGDGQTTFALPDLQSCAVIHQGTSFDNFVIAERSGTESVTLTTSQIPAHTHSLNVTAGSSGNSSIPGGNYSAFDSDGIKEYSDTQNGSMNSLLVKSSGDSQPHDNMQPFLTMTYFISPFGIFPT